ncbi:MAG TPA: VOC family protein [Planctomycetota bacterium]|nr:VOC family protein [Planctomycetota bacterium]
MALSLGPVHHLALLVEDLAAAEAFYAGTLGLRVERRWPEAAGGTRSVWLSLGNDAILMLEKADPGATRRADYGGGWHLLAFTITAGERAKLESDLRARNIAIESRTDYTLYVRDPEGNRIAFSHYPHPVPQRP